MLWYIIVHLWVFGQTIAIFLIIPWEYKMSNSPRIIQKPTKNLDWEQIEFVNQSRFVLDSALSRSDLEFNDNNIHLRSGKYV